jgi:hypothetical protein
MKNILHTLAKCGKPSLAFIVLMPLLLGAWTFPWEEKQDAACVSPAQIKMGERIFYIPRPWKLNVTLVKPGNIRDLCYASEPVGLKEWVAFVPANFLLHVVPEPGSSNPPELQIDVFEETGKDFRTLYQHLREMMRLQKIEIVDLPIENGFRVWRYQDWAPVDIHHQFLRTRDAFLTEEAVYISDDPDLKSPSGEPAIFACKPGQVDKVRNGMCRIRMSIWDGQVDFTAQSFDISGIPQNKWKELYLGLLDLRKALISNSTVNTFTLRHK